MGPSHSGVFFKEELMKIIAGSGYFINVIDNKISIKFNHDGNLYRRLSDKEFRRVQTSELLLSREEAKNFQSVLSEALDDLHDCE